MRFGTMFSGGEGAGVGLRAAGLTHVWGVEYDPAIAAVAQANGFDVHVADVRQAALFERTPADGGQGAVVAIDADDAVQFLRDASVSLRVVSA